MCQRWNRNTWEKANAVLELACPGYLSDNPGIVLYEKAGIDKYGLQKWKCLRGTNNVEGGPHGDIYQKFGAVHSKFWLDWNLSVNPWALLLAGPRLTVNCLTDHRTWYNLQVCYIFNKYYIILNLFRPMQSIGLVLTGNIIMTFPLSIAHHSYLTIFLMFSLVQHPLETG